VHIKSNLIPTCTALDFEIRQDGQAVASTALALKYSIGANGNIAVSGTASKGSTVSGEVINFASDGKNCKKGLLILWVLLDETLIGSAKVSSHCSCA
jgi:hypothetical protein